MDKPISVGDLVVVTGGCCEVAHEQIGWIRTVREIRGNGFTCRHCKSSIQGQGVVFDGTWGRPMNWVKRIPPLSELEGQRTEEDLREPA